MASRHAHSGHAHAGSGAAAAGAPSAADDEAGEGSLTKDLDPSLLESVRAAKKRGYDVFYASHRLQQPPEYPAAQRVRVASRVMDDYRQLAMPETARPPAATAALKRQIHSSLSSSTLLLTSGGAGAAAPLLLLDSSASATVAAAAGRAGAAAGSAGAVSARTSAARAAGGVAHSYAAGDDRGGGGGGGGASASSLALVPSSGAAASVRDVVSAFAQRAAPVGLDADDTASRDAYARVEEMTARAQEKSRAIALRRAPPAVPVPKWHAPWRLMRVISGHMGWVRSVAVDPGNEWFVTGGADRLIKVWDLASGTLKVTLTGHINAIRGLAVSSRHPYMFSAGEDKQVFCWDLETNKIIRKYTGHLSGVYSLALHPTLDVLFTGGRDSVCRVWDIRTKTQVHVLAGHENTVTSILASGSEPQCITASQDTTVRTWDLAAGKVRTVLTHHKKGVRALAAHPKEWAFLSGAADNIKKWALPDGVFVRNFSGHDSIVNCMAMSADDVLVSGADDGSLSFWDYGTGYRFQATATRAQPGSLESENGIFAAAFDQTGLRLITCEADKSIKIWKEDPEASPATHPVDMDAWSDYVRQHKAL